ncbi:Crp/Fnr family transcriptional regulator [Allosphingosinicella deserti]|uniref:Crp/Fnr family transcriptional regulator n=1 Tax=Allosphingosinicella deserti TaxID=2116704 RepID=A0A2P7QI86_9SPHN|nr:Crp/Fnr family transcriptional regulator [Sphingomonas deserti]PSJ37682.1 Crp/Fnr family transcriptional regulator [Sphingomonas deserti]
MILELWCRANNAVKRGDPLALRRSSGRETMTPAARGASMTIASHALTPMLRKLRLWRHLTAREEEALLNLPHHVISTDRLQTLVNDGDVVSHAWLILSGFCVRFKIVGDGGRQILSIHMMGDLLDLQNAILGVADHGIQTLTKCEMARIPLAAIKTLTDVEPNIKDTLWFDTLVDGSIHREWVANVGRRSGKTRVAHLLCEFALKLEAVHPGDQLKYELPMTQEQLADATGLTSVHVNRVLQALAADGLIQRVTSKSILIGDWKKLATAGDFNRSYLHLDAAVRRAGTS